MRLALLSFIPLLGLGAASAAQDEPARPRPAAAVSRMTLDLNDTPLRRSLELVLQGSGIQVQVDPAVADVPVTISLRDVPLRTAVKQIVATAASRQPGLAADLSGAPWRVVRGGPSARLYRGPRSRVALDVTDVPLREAVDRLFAETDSHCVVDANVPDVPVSLKFQGVTLHSGACLVTGAAWAKGVPLSLKRSGDNYQLSVSRVGPEYQQASRNLTGSKPKGRSDLRLYYLPLRQAVRTIPARPGTQLLVEHNVPDVRLRLRLRNLNTESAVSQLCAVTSLQAPGVSYVKSGNVYVIYRPTPAAGELRTTAKPR